MTELQPLAELRRALPDLPPRLRAAARFLAEHDFDAATRSMRDLAGAAETSPTTFTRLARALGYAGWDEFRDALIEARRPNPEQPFSRRVGPPMAPTTAAEMSAAMLSADAANLPSIDPTAIAAAAQALHTASRIWVAGFRSCRGVAQTLHYQLRLFRPSSVHLVGGDAPEDIDIGAFAKEDAVVILGFAPYSQPSVLTAREAHKAGCQTVVIADSRSAPISEGARHLLLFAANGPGFFPSLTGALAISQALAAACFGLGGENALAKLRETERRLSATSAYVPETSKAG